jgi:hypothetical protein
VVAVSSPSRNAGDLDIDLTALGTGVNFDGGDDAAQDVDHLQALILPSRSRGSAPRSAAASAPTAPIERIRVAHEAEEKLEHVSNDCRELGGEAALERR